MWELMQRLAQDRSGATAIEYCLIAGLLSVVILGSIHGMSTSLVSIFTTVNNGFAH